MRLISKVIRILRAKFHCDRLTAAQDIQDHASLIFGTRCTDIPGKIFPVVTATMYVLLIVCRTVYGSTLLGHHPFMVSTKLS